MKTRRLAENLSRCGLPQIYWDAELDNFQGTETNAMLRNALRETKDYLEDPRRNPSLGALFFGKVGCGKTRLLCTVLKELVLKYGRHCLFVEFTRLLGGIRGGYDQSRPESESLDPLLKIDVLAVDELGKGKGSEWETSILDSIVTGRYNAGKPTFFTTNYPPPSNSNGDEGTENLKERVQSRIYSRLQEMCLFVNVGKIDFRTKKYPNVSSRSRRGGLKRFNH